MELSSRTAPVALSLTLKVSFETLTSHKNIFECFNWIISWADPERLLGEVIYQLDRRILSHIFQGQRRFYGFSLLNIPDKIIEVRLKTAHFLKSWLKSHLFLLSLCWSEQNSQQNRCKIIFFLSWRWAPTPWQGGWMRAIASISFRGIKTSWRSWKSLATKPLFTQLYRNSSWTPTGSCWRGRTMAPAGRRITVTLSSWGSGLLQSRPHSWRRKCRFSLTASATWLRRTKNHSSSGRQESRQRNSNWDLIFQFFKNHFSVQTS